MRNLKVVDVVHGNSKYLNECRYVCVDSTTEKLFALNNHEIYLLENDNHHVSVSCVACLGNIEGSQVVGVDFLIEQQSVCVALDCGDLLLFSPETKQVECVGSVSGGIQTISCSPDQELLVVLTGQDTLILMTKDFDPLVEKNLNPEDFGEDKPITVGWGSKETQFHGSEGKEAAKVKTIPVQESFFWDDKRARVSRRGDGKMFAVSTVDPNTGCRKIRIWDREASLLCTSENVNGLEQALHWKPSGSVIASTQRLVNKHEVVFFEKNGLRHREFALKFKPTEYQVKEIVWNSDSSILAVWGCDLQQCGPQSNYSVMLWTVSNYHWYQKQTLNFGDEALQCVHWDPIHPYVLHVITSFGRYCRYRWSWALSISHGEDQKDPANVAVIDGDRVLITPFRILVVPPPFSAYHFQLPSPVNQVIFSQNSNDILILLSDGRLSLFTSGKCITPRDNEACVEMGAAAGNGFKSQIEAHTYVGTFSITWENKKEPLNIPLSSYHWIWVTHKKLLCMVSQESEVCMLNVEVSNDDSENFVFTARYGPSLKQGVLGLAMLDEVVVLLQSLEGSFFQYNIETESLNPWPNNEQLRLPQPCETFSLCAVANQVRVLGLTNRFRLYCDEHEVVNNCTSFQVHDEFLILTTFSHTLCCLLKEYDLLKILTGGSVGIEESAPRNLERGSRIVVAVPSDTKVVLQMPRGNLETIHPRALVLTKVQHCLENLQYGQAFSLMRKHRINLNLLYDDNPKRFEENVEAFVVQLESSTSISLFLNELLEDDMIKKMYAAAYRNRERVKYEVAFGMNKVDTVCEVLRNALIKIDKKKYFLSILTTYAKMTEPQLDHALMEIKNLQDLTDNGASVDEAVRYLMYMVDVNELYNVALGTYDFDVVLMVAEKSQKDPKEYVPFLNELKKLEPHYQKYKIDMHLHYYKKALQNISQSGNEHFDELLILVKNQRLYADALFLFPLKSDHGKTLWKLYGDYLMEKKHYEEAGLVYSKCDHHQDALEAHQQSLNWQMAMCDAIKLEYTDVQMAELSKNIAGHLKMNRRYIEAANLYEHYVQDIEESIATLLDGQEWSAALNLIYKHNRLDLLETHFQPQLIEHSQSIQTMMQQIDEDFNHHSRRLQVVREEKEQNSKMIDEGELWRQADADLFSDTSSITGRSETESSKSGHSGSIATRKTSRRKKRQELKKYSLKEGSAHEDLALIIALSELIKSADDLQETIGKLLKMLVIFNYNEEAMKMQNHLTQILSNMEKTIPSIWSPEPTSNGAIEFGPSATANSLAAALQMQKEKQPTISDPLLRIPPSIQMHIEWKLFMLEK